MAAAAATHQQPPHKRPRTDDATNGSSDAQMHDEKSGLIVADNWINGQLSAPKSGKYLDVHTPHTGAVIGKVALSGPDDVDAAVQAAHAAFLKWSALTVKARMQVIIRFHELVIEHEAQLVELIMKEHGKNRVEAQGSVQKGNETVEYAMSMPQLFSGKYQEVSRGVACHEFRKPLGVVVSIVPFNFPAMVPLWTVPIAIACGNAIIVKPSEKVPLTLRRIAQLWEEAGLPNGVFSLVNGVKEAVESLIDHPTVQAVTFVGSTKVAELVAKRCRGLNKRVLALGGAKNHLVTLPDCNLEMASQDIVNSFTGCAGQRCMAASVLLTVGDQKEMIKQIVEKASTLVPGAEARQVGPVIDDMSLKRILRYIEQSEKLGASILLDGRKWTEEKKQGFWIGPTVILHNDPNDPALHDEIFGPVLSIYRVETKEEAIKIENANPYGNAACVYTSVGENANWFSQHFSAGMIGINVGVPVPREPFSFGGINASKFGDMDITGDGGIEFFTKRIKVTTKWTPPPTRSWMD